MILKVSDYTTTPGARYIVDGDFSGEHFRNTKLMPAFASIWLEKGKKLTVDLDGTTGYASSFLDEAFGGLAIIYGEACLDKLKFVSRDEPSLPEDIIGYIKETWESVAN